MEPGKEDTKTHVSFNKQHVRCLVGVKVIKVGNRSLFRELSHWMIMLQSEYSESDEHGDIQVHAKFEKVRN